MPGGKKTSIGASTKDRKCSRRDFLAAGGAVLTVDAILAGNSANAAAAEAVSDAAKPYPPSKGYLVYDSKKCAGCTTCMLSCSLVHHGFHSLSLARIQVIQDSFGKFPSDVQIAPCRQCRTPVCVENCPVGAAHVDPENGNVRRIDSEKCIGCKTCIAMCPQQPHRSVWNYMDKKSQKCDLCIDTPYWSEKGGPGGRQACVESCPMKALQFVTETPNQKETEGYDRNMRNVHWINLGLVDDSRVIPPVMAEEEEARRNAARRKR